MAGRTPHIPTAAFTTLEALDAIHLATALIWSETRGDDLLLLTHNRQLAIAARACGFEVKSSS